MGKRALHVKIEGRVQGVGYRAWVVQTAQGLGLKGWVRNRNDGSVELVITGGPRRMEDMLRRCEVGPLHARVRSVNIVGENSNTFDKFDVKPTV